MKGKIIAFDEYEDKEKQSIEILIDEAIPKSELDELIEKEAKVEITFV